MSKFRVTACECDKLNLDFDCQMSLELCSEREIELVEIIYKILIW